MEGIDRFRSGKYAGNHAAGFMVGYMLAGDATAAAQDINRPELAAREMEAATPREPDPVEPGWRILGMGEPTSENTYASHRAAPCVSAGFMKDSLRL